MKRFICATMAALMVFSSTVFADTNIFIGDELVQYTDQTPVIINERTYVPIRDVFESLGYEVEWDEESKAVGLSNDYYMIILFTKTNKMLTVQADLEMKYAALENEVQLISGRTMLPLREILENANYSLSWDAETKSTVISDENDYATFDAKKAELEELMTSTGYEFDAEKPSEELTEEEMVYLDSLYSTLNDISKLAEQYPELEGDVEEFTPELAETVKACVSEYLSKMDEIECPESLEGVAEGAENALLKTIDEMAFIAEVMQDNPESGTIAFSLAMFMAVKVSLANYDELKPLYDFYSEKNIDVETLFGEKYPDSIGMLK